MPAHRQAQLIQALCGVVIVTTVQGRWVAPPGRGVWIPAGEEHDLHLLGRTEVRTLFVEPDARADLPPRSQLIAASPLLRELILAALPLPADRPAEGRARHILQLILAEVQGSSAAGLHLPWPSDLSLAELCRHLRQHPGEPWTLARAAARLAVSERTLSRLFLKETGLGFGQWLQRGAAGFQPDVPGRRPRHRRRGPGSRLCQSQPPARSGQASQEKGRLGIPGGLGLRSGRAQSTAIRSSGTGLRRGVRKWITRMATR
ncbi:AraC family ligand binding domain-containing protein [Pseudomonas sp. EpS/L25]|uniref:AraC family ligand binding domain-containing protein n=1 Tax=Pseudomonas sp. EpS/L25 TaxID=1749078 RepID=UPI001EFF9013|nr:AraC family ligand binding domain-containing protein [Pseudomonas sp. EpS/L25]